VKLLEKSVDYTIILSGLVITIMGKQFWFFGPILIMFGLLDLKTVANK
jgi:hypothetical protein